MYDAMYLVQKLRSERIIFLEKGGKRSYSGKNHLTIKKGSLTWLVATIWPWLIFKADTKRGHINIIHRSHDFKVYNVPFNVQSSWVLLLKLFKFVGYIRKKVNKMASCARILTVQVFS